MARYDDNSAIQRQELLRQLRGNTGVSGHAPGGITVPPIVSEAPAAPPAAPDYSSYGSTVGQFLQTNGHGYDPEKIKDPSRGDSGKYVMGRVETHFDPSQGITDDFINALNKQGKGDFYKIDDDEVGVRNGDPSFGRTSKFDLIDKHGNWVYLQNNPGGVEGGAPQPSYMSGPSSFQGIQSLAPTDTDFYNNLQAQMQQILGPGALDREALLKLLGGQQ